MDSNPTIPITREKYFADIAELKASIAELENSRYRWKQRVNDLNEQSKKDDDVRLNLHARIADLESQLAAANRRAEEAEKTAHRADKGMHAWKRVVIRFGRELAEARAEALDMRVLLDMFQSTHIHESDQMGYEAVSILWAELRAKIDDKARTERDTQ